MINFTDDQKVQIGAAALQGVIVARPEWIENSAEKIIERAVSLAALMVAEMGKRSF